MKKSLFVVAAFVAFSLVSCKKDTCKIDGESFTCSESYGHDCSKVELEAFQAACKAYGGKTSTK
jgi:hypothetical protein